MAMLKFYEPWHYLGGHSEVTISEVEAVAIQRANAKRSGKPGIYDGEDGFDKALADFITINFASRIWEGLE